MRGNDPCEVVAAKEKERVVVNSDVERENLNEKKGGGGLRMKCGFHQPSRAELVSFVSSRIPLTERTMKFKYLSYLLYNTWYVYRIFECFICKGM